MQNRRYTIDLRARMAVCDANYLRILKLFPAHQPDSTRIFALPCGTGDNLTLVQLKVTEKFRYTSTLALTMTPEADTGLWFSPPCMLIRLYHDACTAEVVSYQEQPVPAWEPLASLGQAFPSNEKEEVNLFLAECLSLCLNEGMGMSLPETRAVAAGARDNAMQEFGP